MVTEKAMSARRWLSWFKLVGWCFWQIRNTLRPRSDDDVPLVGMEVTGAMLPRKATKVRYVRTVLQTDTGRQVENTKALEKTRVKELGKMTP